MNTVKHVDELGLHEAHWLLCHSEEGEACPDGCDKAAYPEALRRYQSDGPVFVDIRVYWDWCLMHGYPLPAGVQPAAPHHPLAVALSRSAWALFDGIRAAVRS